MRRPRTRGSSSNMVRVFIPDNTSTKGAGLTGLTSASTNLVVAFAREFDSAGTSYAGANIETIATIGTYQAPSTSSKVRFKAVDATNFPGLYELHFHNSATIFGTGDTSSNVIINVFETSTTALNIGPNMCDVPLVPWDWTDGVRLGLTAMPNAAANAAGGLPVSIAGALDMDDLAADVDNIETQIGIAGAGLSGIPKTGFKLASDGLDSVSTTEPTGVASTFRDMVVQGWCRWFRPSSLTTSQLKTFASDGSTLRTTQAVSDNGTTQTQGNAT